MIPEFLRTIVHIIENQWMMVLKKSSRGETPRERTGARCASHEEIASVPYS